MENLANFTLGFVLNFVVAFVIVRFIYYPRTKDKRFVFTFLAFNMIIYFVLSLMVSIELGIGVGFGLFAIFSVLRYRTDPMPIREMTYLFIILALPVMNSTGMLESSWPQLLIANSAVILVLWLLENEWGFRYEVSKHITYEKIELVPPSRRAEMIADLEARTGLRVKKLSVGKIDFLRDTAELQVTFDETDQNGWNSAAALGSRDGSLDE
ncbi:MAG TPA: DUF4956 domain-containing protein [Anaerolineaceae bacterium]|jgi:hypothetical protein|nr:DUF4956 domain-containing protein [Anaerolineaceae bacterium]HPS32787.1 DUF4956 domain-containing protein [Anaerolineaceae bacterium]